MMNEAQLRNLTDKELADYVYQKVLTPLEKELLTRLERKVYYAVEVDATGAVQGVQERLFQ